MVESPCINVCRMHEPSGHCLGCGRTLDEIALWSVLDDDDKRAVRALLPERLAALPDIGLARAGAQDGADGPAEGRGTR
jgi:hypothetical protein